MRTIPNIKMLMQAAETLARMNPDDLASPSQEQVEQLREAIKLSRHALGSRAPKMAREIEVWAAGPEDGADDRAFSQGPAPSLAALGYIPDGHVVMGMSASGTEMARGMVRSDQTIDWSYRLDAQRRTAADHLFETFEAADILNEESSIAETSGWQSRSGSDEWTRWVFVDTGVDGLESVQMDFLVRFAPDSDEIVLAEFDGEDVMPRQDETPEP